MLAVVESKATLYGEQLKDAKETLGSVFNCLAAANVDPTVVDRAYRKIARERIQDSADGSPENKASRMIWDELFREVVSPLRIVIGFAGFSSEYTLREGFLRYLRDRMLDVGDSPASGLAPSDLPSLIICGSHALVKLNALPYSMRVEGREDWELFASIQDRATLVLLEVLWTKISTRFALPDKAFGDDLKIEALSPLLSVSAEVESADKIWHYDFHRKSSKELAAASRDVDWNPAQFGSAEFDVFTFLSVLDGQISIADENFLEIAREHNLQPSALVELMQQTGLVYRTKDDRIALLVDNWVFGVLPGGRAYAGENDERLARWIASQV